MSSDFLTDLPVSGSGHDCIVTVIDHITKRAHWRAGKKLIEALAIVRLFFDDIECLHGVPQEVVSDPDVHFPEDYGREVAWILQTKLLMSTALHSETDSISENSNKMVVRYLCGFATHNKANWDDYLPLAEYAYNYSVHCSTRLMPFEIDLRYEQPLALDLIAHLQRPQANESAKTLPGREFVEQLQHILEVTKDELREAQDEQMAEADKSRRPIDSASTAGTNVFLDTQDLPLTYANVDPIRRELVHLVIGPHDIFQIRRNAVELDLPNDLTIYDTVNVRRVEVDRTDNSRTAWWAPPPPVWTSHAGTRDVVQSIRNHRPGCKGTGWEYEVKREGWYEKDKTWEPEANMAKAKEMVKQYWKEIGRRPKDKGKTTQRKT